MIRITKVDGDDDDNNNEQEVSPIPFSLLYFDLYTDSGILALDDAIRLIKVRYEEEQGYNEKKNNERKGEYISFQNTEEKTILQEFSDYIHDKNPDIIVCLGDYDNGKVLQYLFARAKKIGFDLQLGRDDDDYYYSNTSEYLLTHNNKIKGRICISSNYRQTTYFDKFGFAGLIERARFSFLPLEMATRYGINRLIDSRNCYELIQRGFVIPNNKRAGINSSYTRDFSSSNHEHIRTVEQIVSADKGGMIISPQIGLHENVVALDYDSEYANLIVNYNLSYETVTSKGVVIQSNKKKGLLPTVVERFLKRRVYFKRLLKE